MFLVKFDYLVFLAVSMLAYYIVPGNCQWIVLLIFSMVFYMLAGIPYTVIYLLVAVIAVWIGVNYIEKYREEVKKAKRVLLLCILIVAGLLTALKYTNFLLSTYKEIGGIFRFGQDIQPVSWAASLGISFYSLQAISYLVDVYWGISTAQKNPFKVALFTCYFPQMSSGPISRYHQLGDQLFMTHKFDYNRMCFGLQRILYGFIKKLVIAENLEHYTRCIFNEDARYNGLFLCVGLAVYLFQLYMDFSGCMDIVLGTSECFGIYMSENFNRPFHSRTIQEFWKRWHITLGAWAQDYIMYPILRSKMWTKMRRMMKLKFGRKAAQNISTYLAMAILWFYMGIWHGGAWHYVAEGVWFGLVIMSGQLLEGTFKKWIRILKINTKAAWWHGFQSIRTGVIFAIGVLFFIAVDIRQAFWYIKAAFSPKCWRWKNFIDQIRVFFSSFAKEDVHKTMVCIAVGVALVTVLLVFQAKERSFYKWLADRNIVIRWTFLYIMLFTVILFGVYGPGYTASDFIYGGF